MATNAHNARLTSNCGMPHKPPPPRLSLMAQCPYGTFYSSSTGECHTCTPEALAAGPARERAEALCDKCSAESALCLGGQNPLLSRAGFWRVAADVGYRLSRCSPLSSCDGQNGCALGYEGSECSECAADFSRNYITNACVPCPSLPGLYFAGMLILALVLAFVLQKLYKKGPSVAAIGITIDYFQVTPHCIESYTGWVYHLGNPGPFYFFKLGIRVAGKPSHSVQGMRPAFAFA